MHLGLDGPVILLKVKCALDFCMLWVILNGSTSIFLAMAALIVAPDFVLDFSEFLYPMKSILGFSLMFQYPLKMQNLSLSLHFS